MTRERFFYGNVEDNDHFIGTATITVPVEVVAQGGEYTEMDIIYYLREELRNIFAGSLKHFTIDVAIDPD